MYKRNKLELSGCATGLFIAIIGSVILWFIIIMLFSCNLTYQTRSGEYNWQGQKIDTLTIKK